MYKTEQENFGAGQFGDEYIERNKSDIILSSNLALFSKILARTKNVNSVVEFGSNIGMNLKAIKLLKPQMKCCAVEINKKATEILKKDPLFQGELDVITESILDVSFGELYDMALIKGVLIHINPDMLNQVYEKLYLSSRKYICIAEYYNPTPMMVAYRGNEDRLFKRDFAGEFLDKYDDCKLVDYGFVYRRDNNFAGDDITWFLLEKGD